MTHRALKQIIPALETSDGAGVKIKRSLGQRQSIRMDPFLMLDEFGSDQPQDYIAGFPAHPHRGFETVTYMIEGHMLHEDHLGNRGNLRNGGVQWMTAGRGIVHSEMPQQESGLMRGFQLWLNLPAAEKMKPAGYRDIQPEDIPAFSQGGATVKLEVAAVKEGDDLMLQLVADARGTDEGYHIADNPHKDNHGVTRAIAAAPSESFARAHEPLDFSHALA